MKVFVLQIDIVLSGGFGGETVVLFEEEFLLRRRWEPKNRIENYDDKNDDVVDVLSWAKRKEFEDEFRGDV